MTILTMSQLKLTMSSWSTIIFLDLHPYLTMFKGSINICIVQLWKSTKITIGLDLIHIDIMSSLNQIIMLASHNLKKTCLETNYKKIWQDGNKECMCNFLFKIEFKWNVDVNFLWTRGLPNLNNYIGHDHCIETWGSTSKRGTYIVLSYFFNLHSTLFVVYKKCNLHYMILTSS